MFIDTHCHLWSVSKKLGISCKELLEKSISSGLSQVINLNLSLEEFEKIEIFDWPNQILHVAGLHPSDYKKIPEDLLDLVENLAKNKKIVAIGETGLDYYWHPEDRDVQFELFQRQLQIAQNNDLPVILHFRNGKNGEDCIKDAFEILKDFPKVKSVWHCFTGTFDEVTEFFSINSKNKIGVGGIITFKNSESLRQTIRQISLDRIIIETDAPYLAPEPNRGKICEPHMVKDTYIFLANFFEIELQDFAIQIEKSVREFFKV